VSLPRRYCPGGLKEDWSSWSVGLSTDLDSQVFGLRSKVIAFHAGHLRTSSAGLSHHAIMALCPNVENLRIIAKVNADESLYPPHPVMIQVAKPNKQYLRGYC